MKWSQAQTDAIEAHGQNLLVAAAAGSGKTAVLVERIIRQVLHGALDVDKLLVVTFTKASAAEMRERIEAALIKAQEEQPNDRNIKRQLTLLSNSSISTIHTFCQNVIRRNFASIDIDPKFRVAGEQEVILLKQETMETLFESYYEMGDADFLHLADTYGTERGDDTIERLIDRLYTFSESQPFPDMWLTSLCSRFLLQENCTLTETAWGEVILRDIAWTLERAKAICTLWKKQEALLDFDAYASTRIEVEAFLQNVAHALQTRTWAAIGAAVRCAFPVMKRAPTGTPDEVKKPLQQHRLQIKAAMDGLIDRYFSVPEQALLDDLRVIEQNASAIVRVVLAFRRAFQDKKREKGVVDFGDLEHFALQILQTEDSNPGHLHPSQAALELQAKYQEVMVDEYQDTNGVQEAILQLVTRGDNLFTVGDVKQSIYRFRLADPSLFMEKYQQYPKEPEVSKRIDLKENFRSRREVLRSINFLFAQLMQEETMELVYDDAAALYPGLDYPEHPHMLSSAVELILIDRDNETAQQVQTIPDEDDAEEVSADGELTGEERKGFELEAIEIAKRLHDLKRRDTYVFDQRTAAYRPMVWRDVAILLRSEQGKGEVLVKALRAYGIPAFATTSGGYFEQTEVRIILALLSVIDNARQDIPLAAVLHSPIVGLTLEELALIRMEEREDDLFAALIKSGGVGSMASEEMRQKIGRFLRQLSTWRILARRVSVPALIWQIYRDTGYYEYAGGLPGGLLRQANLRILSDRAADYEATNYRGLFRFLRYIERLLQRETDLSSARTLGEGEDVVRIMTIHKSKGLEFPIVFLADLGKQFNLSDAQGDFLIHRELGLGMYVTDRKKSIQYSTIAREAISMKIAAESKAEELRVLYVALTRAREKLILVGSLKKLRRRVTQWCRFTGQTTRELPSYATLEAKCYLDWIGMCVVRHADGAVLADCSTEVVDRVLVQDVDDCRWHARIVPAMEVRGEEEEEQISDDVLRALERRVPLEDVDVTRVEEILSWRYPHVEDEDIASKVTVTEIKRRLADRMQSTEDEAWGKLPLFPMISNVQTEDDYPRPSFLQSAGKMRPNEYGILMHTVMQHITLQKVLDTAGIKEELHRLVQEEYISAEQMPAIRVKDIARFFTSSLGQRLQQAMRVWRELPFSRTLSANRFYDTAQEGTNIFLQGTIDVLFQESDGRYFLLDYKTDADTNPAQVKEKYEVQMRIYREAVEEMLDVPICACYLVLLKDGTSVAL